MFVAVRATNLSDSYSDYHRTVESFGAHGIVVTKNEDIARALEEAKHVADQGRPVLVNVHIGTCCRAVGSAVLLLTTHHRTH